MKFLFALSCVLLEASCSCQQDNTALGRMYRAEVSGDLVLARDLAAQVAEQGRQEERLAAVRFFVRHKDFPAVVKATGGLQAVGSDALRTELLEFRIDALVGLGRGEDGIEEARASVEQLPEEPRRHLSLAKALMGSQPSEALTEVREALVLLPAADRVVRVVDANGRTSLDPYFSQALEMYGLLRKRSSRTMADGGQP